MDIEQVMQAAATIVAARITDRATRGQAPMTPDEIALALANARDAIFAAMKIPSKG